MNEFKLNELQDAINIAWENNDTIFLYPYSMNKIIVCELCEQDAYLSNTASISAEYYSSKDEFSKEIIDLYNFKYGFIGSYNN